MTIAKPHTIRRNTNTFPKSIWGVYENTTFGRILIQAFYLKINANRYLDNLSPVYRIRHQVQKIAVY